MKRKFFTLLTMSLALGTSVYAQCPQEGETATDTIIGGDIYYLRTTKVVPGTAADLNTNPYFATTKNVAGGDSVYVIAGNDAAKLASAGDSALWRINKLAGDIYYSYTNKATGNTLTLSNGNVSLSKFGWNFGAPTQDGPQALAATNNYINYQVILDGTADTVKLAETTTAGVGVYPTTPGWVKLTADQLNAMYSDYFKLTDNSATSKTTQAQASHAAIENYFHAVPTTTDPTIYNLNVVGTDKYLKVDTIYYNRLGIIDSTAQLGGHTLAIDSLTSVSLPGLASSYEFTIWKKLVNDSLAVQVNGIPKIAALNAGETFAADGTSAVDPELAWITLSSYDAGYESTALTAATGCFSTGMPNPSFSMEKGKGLQVKAGYYYIYNQAQDSMYVAQLNNRLGNENFVLIPVNEGKQYVAAAQWYVPTTSYYPTIFNRESSMKALVDNTTDQVSEFYSVVNAAGDTVPNTYKIQNAVAGIDTIVMIPFESNDIYLGYKRFANSPEAQEVSSVYFQFNTALNPGTYAYVSPNDTLLSVAPIEMENSLVYQMLPVDTFSIGNDTLRAISYKFFTTQPSALKATAVDTLWLSSPEYRIDFRSLVDPSNPTISDLQMVNTKVAAQAGVYLVRATYEAGKYQILSVLSTDAQLLSSAERQAKTLGVTPIDGFKGYLNYQVSVAASNANMYRNNEITALDGVWSFVNTLNPDYATLTPAPAHYTFTSSQNVDLSISMNNVKSATLKGTSDLKNTQYTEDNFKLFVQCVDADTVKPLYMISTQQAAGLVGDTALFLNTVKNYPYTAMGAQDSLGFAKAVLEEDSFTVAGGTKVAAATGAPLYTFAFQNTSAPNTYIIEAGDTTYLAQFNGVLVGVSDIKEALPFVVKPTSTPTSNEGVTVSEVTVIAGQGNVTIAGAAGKKVVISNIIGQVVANTVLSSDNAVVAAPQGVVVVAVEGEAAVKAIVK